MSEPSTTQPPPWNGQAYSVKRHGISIANCDAEPVQTPGCIQAHGVLLVVRPSDLVILQASENSAALVGLAPEKLLGTPISIAVGNAGEEQVRASLDGGATEASPLRLFTLPSHGDRPALDVSMHTLEGLALVEFEPRAVDEGWPVRDCYALVHRAVGRLRRAAGLQEFCTVAAEEIRKITGLDRVMVYKFHEDGHGEVFAESRREDLAPWLGLHYPADDIPKPAREVFKRVWIRPMPDVSGALAEMVPLVNPATGRPLTMTYCALRGASVMYTEYLQNMGVTAGLTMSLRRGEELWGLIACHHYGGMAGLPVEERAACELLAQVVSMQHRAVEEKEHRADRLRLEESQQQVVTRLSHSDDLSAMANGRPTMLEAIDADGAALHHHNRWWKVGRTPTDVDLDALARWVNARSEFSADRPLFSTDRLGDHYPGGAALAAVASGLLAVPLSTTRETLLMWFRPETMQTVHWGGNPQDKPMVLGPHGLRLTPRRSFELFAESVAGRSLPWSAVDIELALRFRTMIMEVVVSRAERLTELNAELGRSNVELEAFALMASHDLKEPLRGMRSHARRMLEDPSVHQGSEGRQQLERLVRLTQRMELLLDSLLHFSRVGHTALTMEAVDLNEVVAEAIDMLDTRRSAQTPEIVVAGPLPTIECDRPRIREIYVNLLSNALKYNDKPVCQVEIGCLRRPDSSEVPAGSDGAFGHTVCYVRDNGIGIEPQHVDRVFEMFRRLHGPGEFGGGAGAGLAIVKSLVERHGGKVWILSMPSSGTTVFFTLNPDLRPASTDRR